mmetsp:Transcript_2982/g.7416  ORF Transcript_2982/g.7416 Transcript_2982/m.7416 type:complete len:144 (+) Transcript_2982:68-499(+)
MHACIHSKLTRAGGIARTSQCTQATHVRQQTQLIWVSPELSCLRRRDEDRDQGRAHGRPVLHRRSGIHAGKACANLLELPGPHDAALIEQIIVFSGDYLHMPWLTLEAARKNLESIDAATRSPCAARGPELQPPHRIRAPYAP